MKIGLWYFNEEVPSQRKTKNRPKGKIIMKTINSVNKNLKTDNC